MFFRERKKLEEFGSGPRFVAGCKFRPSDADEIAVESFTFVAPRGIDVVEDAGDLIIR